VHQQQTTPATRQRERGAAERDALEQLVAYISRWQRTDRPWMVRFDTTTSVLNEARAVLRQPR
jgi:hypothetical protein